MCPRFPAHLLFNVLDKFTDSQYQASIFTVTLYARSILVHVTQYCKTVLLSAFFTDAVKFAKINSYTIFHLQGLNWGNQNPGNMLSLGVKIGQDGVTLTPEWRTGSGPPDTRILGACSSETCVCYVAQSLLVKYFYMTLAWLVWIIIFCWTWGMASLILWTWFMYPWNCHGALSPVHRACLIWAPTRAQMFCTQAGLCPENLCFFLDAGFTEPYKTDTHTTAVKFSGIICTSWIH